MLSHVFYNNTNILYITWANITNFDSSKKGVYVSTGETVDGGVLLGLPDLTPNAKAGSYEVRRARHQPVVGSVSQSQVHHFK